MSRRREPVPVTSLTEADRFRSNVAPPPAERLSLRERAGQWLFGLAVIAGLVGALVFGIPALRTPSGPSAQQTQQSQQSQTQSQHSQESHSSSQGH